nr:MAG TPA: hypothetical protein [Caudoviricetes sp.]
MVTPPSQKRDLRRGRRNVEGTRQEREACARELLQTRRNDRAESNRSKLG